MKTIAFITLAYFTAALFGDAGILFSAFVSILMFCFLMAVRFIIICFNTPMFVSRGAKPLPFKIVDGNNLWPF